MSYKNIADYLFALDKEIKFYSSQNTDDRIITSIFFGGGTPSFMEPEYISSIIQMIKRSFNVAENAEITLETNPGTVNQKKIERFKEVGVNRMSIGIQSFNDDELQFLTRIHNSALARKTVNDAFEAGIENLSIDLIFNLPGQTKEKWKSNLLKAIDLPIKHISAYSLILEHGTVLNKMVLDGKVKMQDDDFDADLYDITIDFLAKHGFAQYEVSNFSKPGYECRHNNAYWHYQDYYGFGPSAHSFVNGKRWWNYTSLKFYIANIKSKGNALRGYEELSDKEMQDEFIMLALRSNGLDINELNMRFGDDWIIDNYDKIKEIEKEGYLISSDNFVKFTKKGYAISNEILAKLL